MGGMTESGVGKGLVARRADVGGPPGVTLVLYHLERHSDHHANPTRRYQSLRHFDDAPQLPSGYGLMICLAYVPAVWRRVMDGRVLAHYGGDVTRANLAPHRRAALLARYGA
jgi:alkane 1-monooxygenase